ncbi:MAG: GNAT family N-acetyltransferase [Bacteroidales bacterium]|nr:GNAT family N-acetyltransferase [Bacteroidales bacterium]
MKITLRAIEPGDIDAIYRWENDPAIWIYSAAHQPFSRHALQKFIDESSDTDIYTSRQLRLMADNETGEPVGCVDIYDFDPFHHRASVGILVDSSMRNKGYGFAILHALEEFASTHLALHQLHSIVTADNNESISLFEKAGYLRCGTLHDWVWANGSWADAFSYQKILDNDEEKS